MCLEELKQLKYKIKQATDKYTYCQQNIVNCQMDVESTQKILNDILLSRQFYRKSIDIIYERSIKELKDTLNAAIGYVFSDQNYEVDIQLSDKRGKSLSLAIYDNGNLVSLKTGMGMGVNCVISAVLHLYYLQCKNSNILMLDEAYHNISELYIERFFDFLEKLVLKIGFKLIMITHDERVIPYANKVYRINDGRIAVIKDNACQTLKQKESI